MSEKQIAHMDLPDQAVILLYGRVGVASKSSLQTKRKCLVFVLRFYFTFSTLVVVVARVRFFFIYIYLFIVWRG